MTTLDQFESAFARADKATFHLAPESVRKVLFLSDLDAEATAARLEELKRFLVVLEEGGSPPEWHSLGASDYAKGPELLAKIAELEPDLIVTYRLLKEITRDQTYSLGTYLDVLSQTLVAPILVIPRDPQQMNLAEGTPQVLAVTGHLTGDDRLINWALPFVRGAKGDLFLGHIEDDHAFERYLKVIEKVPGLDTETAREGIRAQLLKEPSEFVDSVRATIHKTHPELQVHGIVRLGHRVRDFSALVTEHAVDLLVIEGKDESQAAMSGLAYSLAVELTTLPILIL